MDSLYHIAILLLLIAEKCGSQNIEAGKGPESVVSQPRGTCKTCIFVLERVKRGIQHSMDGICEEIWFNSFSKTDYESCFNTIDAIIQWKTHVHKWITDGCYRKETYGFLRAGQDMIKISPCPSHVICSEITNPYTKTEKKVYAVESETKKFCPKPKDEYDEDFFKDFSRVRNPYLITKCLF